MKILETERLVLRLLTVDDAPFIFKLLNEPSWLRFIGDRGVRTCEDARNYLVKGPLAMYQRLGFGLNLATLKDSGMPLGVCGLIKRDTLPDVDIGFAFLPEFWGRGYALEAARAVLEQGKVCFGTKRIVAIASPDNSSSIKLLAKIGFTLEQSFTLNVGEPPVNLYAYTI
jgi:RimJ/RimL family protein N-acetyltransferase